jgi:hypothetical protein
MGYYCGIDLGNKSSMISIIQKNRQVVKEKEIATNKTAIGKALSGYRNLTCIVDSSLTRRRLVHALELELTPVPAPTPVTRFLYRLQPQRIRIRLPQHLPVLRNDKLPRPTPEDSS